jgi:hypothetical protein
MKPAHYYGYNDKNRWRQWIMFLQISYWQLSVYLPFKRLPDYIPTEREQKYRDLDKDRDLKFGEYFKNATKKL